MKIFSNQPFKIELTYNQLPATPHSVLICYRKPPGLKGSFSAQIDIDKKVIYYYSAPGETLGAPGNWEFWSVIVDALGQRYPGEKFKMTIYREGE